MVNTWVLVANSSEATIYNLDHEQFVKGKVRLKIVDSRKHDDSKKKVSDLVSDKLGSFRSTATEGHGSFTAPTDPKQHEAEAFAIELSQALEAEHGKNKFQKLIIVAPPHFVGLLNKHLHKNVSSVISTTIEKDYAKIPNKQLVEYMEHHLLAE